VKSSVRQLYQQLVPVSVRRLPFVAALARRLSSRFAHDLLYTAEYFDTDVERVSAQAAPAFASLIAGDFGPVRIIDVGCGTGVLLAALRTSHPTVVGLEYAEAGLARCRARGLDVRKFDLERDTWPHGKETFDLAISMEVAEHLPAAVADQFVELLVTLAPCIVFTAATVGQGGLDHVNEQPHSYWIEKFAEHGCEHQERDSIRWRDQLMTSGCAAFYYENLMLYRRRAPS